MRAGVAGEVLDGRVCLAAVFADVLVGLLALEEDVLAFATETVRTTVFQERLGVGILCAAALAIDGCGFWRGFASFQLICGGI